MLTNARFIRCLRLALAMCLCLAVCVCSETSVAQEQDSRPVLRRQGAPMQSYGVPDAAVDHYARKVESSRTEAAPGLVLPSAGHVWALDRFAGQPQLVQLKYTLVQANNHMTANTVKASIAPFAKQKATWELPGAAALVRLHDATPAIFFVSAYSSDDAADPAATLDGLALVRLHVHDGNRVVSTTAFTQFTSKAKRSEDQVEAVIEKVGDSGWCKIFPKEPLPHGEYALVRLPKQATMLGASIFDFAIDPEAPQNANALLGDSAKKD